MFGAPPAGDMIRETGEVFRELSNIFGIADYDIQIVGYDDSGADHNRTLHKSVPDIKK